MALPTPFDEPPRAPLADNGQVWANWSKWFWQIYKRIKDGALGGTVTSVALAAPTEFVVSGSPITGAGTLTLTKKVETANFGWFGPETGTAAQPTFRALVTADMPAGTGTVTSVAQTVPSAEFAVSGSPITTSGTLAITKQVQNANKGWFGPTTGADAQPTFRALVTADLPSGTGTVTSVDVSGGTTGLTTSGGPITGSGTITIAGQVNLGALNPSALAFAASYG